MFCSLNPAAAENGWGGGCACWKWEDHPGGHCSGIARDGGGLDQGVMVIFWIYFEGRITNSNGWIEYNR